LLVRSGILLLFHGAPPDAPPEVRAAALVPAEAAARVPVLDPLRFAAAVALDDDGHVDVDALLGGYLRGARRAGATLRTGVDVAEVRVEGGRARGVTTSAGERIDARWIVDAAGAWAGRVAELAGAAPIALRPLRRSIGTFATPPGIDATRWPLVAC